MGLIAVGLSSKDEKNGGTSKATLRIKGLHREKTGDSLLKECNQAAELVYRCRHLFPTLLSPIVARIFDKAGKAPHHRNEESNTRSSYCKSDV